MCKLLYSDKDELRITSLSKKMRSEDDSTYRTNFRRDYGRLIHSPSFRRLQGKTQLFPWAETDFFRNRLTHSLEVAQIAKMIAIKINKENEFFNRQGFQLDTDIIEFAGLAHDIGHPPFGHTGEKVLDQLMKEHGGFEGNAQTLRLLAKVEKREINHPKSVIERGIDRRCGLNLTFRSLASVLKYNNEIPFKRTDGDKLVKGYYSTEAELVKRTIRNVTGYNNYQGIFKTIECQIMDIADDIAYSTYDLEDAFKAKFVSPLDCLSISDELASQIGQKVSENLNKPDHNLFSADDVRKALYKVFGAICKPNKKDYAILAEICKRINGKYEIDQYMLKRVAIAYNTALQIQDDGYLRTRVTSELVGKFIDGIRVEPNKEIPALSKVFLDEETQEIVEVLKHFIFESLILSPRLNIVAKRGYEIVEKIFNTLIDAQDGYGLLPDDYKYLYQNINGSEKHRIICDFIAGMTDRYAIEFYGRLTSENPETIFKPF